MSINKPYPPLNEQHPYFHWRRPEIEDDNISAAKEIKRQNRRNKIQHSIKRCLPFTNVDSRQPANLAAPQTRPFKWMITSYHLPEEYQGASARQQSPWYLVLRCLLVDLFEQLENGIGTSWQDLQVQENDKTTGFLHLSRGNCSTFPRLRWGRRIVFSEQTNDEPRWLTGDWLIVAYLWSDDREWLRSAKAEDLISFQNAFW